MTRQGKEHKDIIIIGGGLAGLTAAHMLSHLGVDTLLVERDSALGGGNRSLRDQRGNSFDKGYHALDCDRSRVTERFFQRVLGGRCLPHPLRRGIALKDELLDYNAPLSQWPESLRALFDTSPEVDDLSGEITEAKLRGIYGERFSRFVYDEVLSSYPSKRWALAQGGRAEDHMGIIYPWFFPRTAKSVERDNEWDRYHDRMRHREQSILYPEQGGFEAFVTAIAEDVDRRHAELLTGTAIDFQWQADGVHLAGIRCGERELSADRYLWCAPPPLLFKALSIPFSVGVPQELVLGNFEFEAPIDSEYLEILVGSAQHLINRIGFPDKLAGKGERLLQVEFYFPKGEYALSAEQWRDSWSQSLRTLGVAAAANKPRHFEFYSEIRGVATVEPLEAIKDQFQQTFAALETNIRIPYLNMGPENINRVVPGVLAGVADILRETP